MFTWDVLNESTREETIEAKGEPSQKLESRAESRRSGILTPLLEHKRFYSSSSVVVRLEMNCTFLTLTSFRHTKTNLDCVEENTDDDHWHVDGSFLPTNWSGCTFVGKWMIDISRFINTWKNLGLQ